MLTTMERIQAGIEGNISRASFAMPDEVEETFNANLEYSTDSAEANSVEQSTNDPQAQAVHSDESPDASDPARKRDAADTMVQHRHAVIHNYRVCWEFGRTVFYIDDDVVWQDQSPAGSQGAQVSVGGPAGPRQHSKS